MTQVSGADLPGIATSKIDVNAKPIYEPAGKPITQINIDEGTNSHFNFNFKAFAYFLVKTYQRTKNHGDDLAQILLITLTMGLMNFHGLYMPVSRKLCDQSTVLIKLLSITKNCMMR